MSPKRLTPKEVEALEFLSIGLTTKQIARRVGENMPTISSRITRAQGKLGTSNRAHAVGVAITSGLIRGPQAVECVVSVRRSLAEFSEDFKILEGRGLPRREVADKLGITLDSLNRMLLRARNAGLLPRPLGGGRS